MGADFKKQIASAYDFAMAGPIAKLTLLTSVLSVVRLSVDLWTLPQAVVLSRLLAAYTSVFHAPIDIFVSMLPFQISLSATLKDGCLLYILLGFLYQRVVWRQIRFNYRHPWYIQHRSRNSKALFALQSALQLLDAGLLWPIRLWAVARRPHLVVGLGGHGPSALNFESTRPVADGRTIYFGDARLVMCIRLPGLSLVPASSWRRIMRWSDPHL